MVKIIHKIYTVGKTTKNSFGTEMKIIKELPNGKCIVEFQDKFKYQKEIHNINFKNGTVKNPYDKIRYGVGYIGAGSYKVESILGTHDKSYDTWQNMLERCYSEKLRHKHLSYTDCTVCDEWLNYQNFAKWFDKNYYDINEGRMHLDKDILKENNKEYSPETCVFVPQRINMIFMTKSNSKGLPNGIKITPSGKYSTLYNTIYLGTYDTLEESMIYYNEEKIIHIQKVAEEYKKKIPKKLYKALNKFNGNMLKSA